VVERRQASARRFARGRARWHGNMEYCVCRRSACLLFVEHDRAENRSHRRLGHDAVELRGTFLEMALAKLGRGCVARTPALVRIPDAYFALPNPANTVDNMC
jgi:hypothetical protein